MLGGIFTLRDAACASRCGQNGETVELADWREVFCLRGSHGAHRDRQAFSRWTTARIGSGDGAIRFWDLKTGEPGLVLESLLGDAKCLAYSHIGRWIVSGHDIGALQLWEMVAGEPGPALRGHTGDL